MKFTTSIIFLFFSLFAIAAEIVLHPAEIHPEIYISLKNYPPLQMGGYRIEKIDEAQYIVIGIGKASIMKNDFFKAARVAELDAELQIAKALNPSSVTVETTRSKTTITKSKTDNGKSEQSVERESNIRKFAKILTSSQTPFIISCGIWQHGKYVFCARAVFVGKFDHFSTEAKLSDEVANFKDYDDDPKIFNNLPEVIKAIENVPYLSCGGTILLDVNEIPYLITAVLVPGKQPPSKQLIFARKQAHKNMIAFVSGGKLENQLVSITRSFTSDEQNDFRISERRKLTNKINGEFKFIQPIAKWKVNGTNNLFYLYAVKLGSI